MFKGIIIKEEFMIEEMVSEMTPKSICSGCGRSIEKKFVYCPWCGASKLANTSTVSEEERMDFIFNRLEEMQINNRFERIEKMGDKLNQLEKELDALVLCSEMHK